VNKWSAIVPGQPNAESIEIHKDHKAMVRMKSAKDADFETVSSHLLLMCEDATEKIRVRWEQDKSANDDAGSQ
jgi:hypothetical protein